jgi:hypothetical protein
MPWRNHARITPTCLCAYLLALFDQDDLMPIFEQFIGGSDSDDAAPQDDNAHQLSSKSTLFSYICTRNIGCQLSGGAKLLSK